MKKKIERTVSKIKLRRKESSQIVFFTHHKHLVRLAESFVSDEILRVHEL